MKTIRLLTIVCVVLCCLCALSACGESIPQLSAPVDVKVEDATLTLTWKAVKDARLYTVLITAEGEKEGREVIASKNSYALSSLTEGTYEIKVKANGKQDVNEDSPWSEPIPFVREAEPGMVFTLINGGTEYEVTNKGNATGNIVIPDIYRNKPVTSIGKKAFFNKSDVTGVKLGANIKTVGEYAFGNCSYLTTVEFSKGLTSIGESAFAGCRLLEGTIEIPEGVTYIPANTFAYCAKITEVKLGPAVTSIGEKAFTDCKGLTSLTLPDSVISIDASAFFLCESLSSVKLSESLVSIGDYAFSDNPSITSVVIPNSVKTIGEGAFFECTALETVQLGSGVEKIALGAFMSTKLWESSETNEVYVGKWFLGLKNVSADKVTLRDDTYAIANQALMNNQKLTSMILPDSLKIIGDGAFALSSITGIAIGSGVEIIGAEAFQGCSKLSGISLGAYRTSDDEPLNSSLIEIDSYAFMKCTSLQWIQIPETVTTIGSYAFKDSGLPAQGGLVYAGNWLVGYKEDFTGEASVAKGTVGIANYAFYQCKELTSVKLPESLKLLGRAAFYECTALTTVELPETLEHIEDYTFYRCSNLKLFALPNALKTIGRSAFYKCGTTYIDPESDTNEDTLVIPIGVEVIGDYAFYGCGEKTVVEGGDVVIRGLDIVMMGDNVTHIGAYAFYGMISLKQVSVGNGLVSIGEKAFFKCEQLTTFTVGNGLKTIGEKAFYQCEALTSVSLPASMETIGAYAFYRCYDLVSVQLGGTEIIGDYAFFYCSALEELTLPVSLKQIGKQAFRNCKALTSVSIGSQIESIDQHAFYGCSALTLYCEPAAAPEGWNTRWNSGYRPVVWGCTLSEEKDYVLSYGKEAGSIKNLNATNTLSDPTRAGWVFLGWGANSSATNASYTSANLNEAPDGRRLYAIWVEQE